MNVLAITQGEKREPGPGQWAWDGGGIPAIPGGELEAFDDRWDVPVKVR